MAARAVHFGHEPLVKTAEIGEPCQDVAPGAHPELSLELAEPPVSVSQLLLE